MKLALLNNKLPIKAYPQEELNTIILTQLMPFISGLLSLTDEVSAQRLKIALPAIKEHCWSMGFAEIKKMFEMYVDNKLSITPLPNYFDRILLGKIFKAYKDQQKVKKMDTTDYKEQEDILSVITSFDSFVQDQKIRKENYWIYTYLEGKGILEYSNQEKQTALEICKQNKKPEEDAIELSKLKLLKRFYSNLESKGNHIKNLL